MGATPWTSDEDRTLARLHADGLSVSAIARKMHRSKGAVSDHARMLGLSFDRSRTNAATIAHQDDAAARRARLQVDLLEDAERLRKQLWQPAVIHNFGGRDNTHNSIDVDEPVFADKLKIVQAVGVAIDKSVRLAEHDAGAGAEKVVGLLQATAAALGLTDQADQQPPDQPASSDQGEQ